MIAADTKNDLRRFGSRARCTSDLMPIKNTPGISIVARLAAAICERESVLLWGIILMIYATTKITAASLETLTVKVRGRIHFVERMRVRRR